MDLATLRTGVHNIILEARRLERIIANPEFEALYTSLTSEDKAHVSGLVKQNMPDQLILFISKKVQQEIGEMSVRQLRAKASALCISGYSVMSKESLIRAILTEQARMRSRAGQAARVESRSSVLLEQGQPGTQDRPREVPERLLQVATA